MLLNNLPHNLAHKADGYLQTGLRDRNIPASVNQKVPETQGTGRCDLEECLLSIQMDNTCTKYCKTLRRYLPQFCNDWRTLLWAAISAEQLDIMQIVEPTSIVAVVAMESYILGGFLQTAHSHTFYREDVLHRPCASGQEDEEDMYMEDGNDDDVNTTRERQRNVRWHQLWQHPLLRRALDLDGSMVFFHLSCHLPRLTITMYTLCGVLKQQYDGLIDRYKEDEVLYHVYYVHVDNTRRVHLIITGHQLARDEIRKILTVCGWRLQMTKWYHWVRLVISQDPNERERHHFGYWQPVI